MPLSGARSTSPRERRTGRRQAVGVDQAHDSKRFPKKGAAAARGGGRHGRWPRGRACRAGSERRPPTPSQRRPGLAPAHCPLLHAPLRHPFFIPPPTCAAASMWLHPPPPSPNIHRVSPTHLRSPLPSLVPCRSPSPLPHAGYQHHSPSHRPHIPHGSHANLHPLAGLETALPLAPPSPAPAAAAAPGEALDGSAVLIPPAAAGAAAAAAGATPRSPPSPGSCAARVAAVDLEDSVVLVAPPSPGAGCGMPSGAELKGKAAAAHSGVRSPAPRGGEKRSSLDSNDTASSGASWQLVG